MNTVILTVAEFSLLVLIAVLVTVLTRACVLFGKTKLSLTLLAVSLVICVFTSLYYYKSYKSLSIPETERVKALVVDEERVYQTLVTADAIQPLNARRDFLLSGSFGKYQSASGQVIQYFPLERDIQSRAEVLIAIARQDDQAISDLSKSIAWGLCWIPLALFGYFYARRELRILVDRHGFQRRLKQKTFAEIDGFVNLLVGACVDSTMQSTLETILSQPDQRRKQMLVEMVAQLRETHAPKSLVDAFICLMDDQAAERAYTAIYACRR